jgi:hypothetical protein
MTQQDSRASAVALPDANDFDIVGTIKISYSSTSINARPRPSYHDAELDLNFAGDEITRVATSVGEMVTVALENCVDEFIRTFCSKPSESRRRTDPAHLCFRPDQPESCRRTGSISSTELPRRSTFDQPSSKAARTRIFAHCTPRPAALAAS